MLQNRAGIEEERSSSFVENPSVPPDSLEPSFSVTGAVLLDCDGTLLDTEKLRSTVSFLLLAPFILGDSLQDKDFTEFKDNYIMSAAGKSFEQMIEDVDAQRQEKGLRCIAECWNSLDVDPTIMAPVLAARVALELPPSPSGASVQAAKVLEERNVLMTCSVPCEGMPEVINAFRREKVPFCIASTSSRPSLLASLEVAGQLENFVPELERVHSGESDFDPPRHKPKPDVYLKAASALNVRVGACVAVEDSASGVGSAANAGIGFIIGYVGGGHILPLAREEAASILFAGHRSDNGRGADVVVSHASALPAIINAWRCGKLGTPPLDRALVEKLVSCNGSKVWTPCDFAESRAKRLRGMF